MDYNRNAIKMQSLGTDRKHLHLTRKIYVNRLDYQVLNNNAYLNTQILYIKHIRIDTRSKKNTSSN